MAWRLFNIAMPFLQASHRHGDAQGKKAAEPRNDGWEQEKGPVDEPNCPGENGRRFPFVQPECVKGEKSWRGKKEQSVPVREEIRHFSVHDGEKNPKKTSEDD